MPKLAYYFDVVSLVSLSVSDVMCICATATIDVINVYKRLLLLVKNHVYKRFLFVPRLLKIINVDIFCFSTV